jgi:hypothetical protein
MAKVEPPKDDLDRALKDYTETGSKTSIHYVIKLQQEALLTKLEAELPEKRPAVDPINSRTLDGIADANYNSAIDQVKTTINKLRLEL